MNFKSEDLRLFWLDPVAYPPRRMPSSLRKATFRKLQMLDAACSLNDLRVPPGNKLEALQGNRKGQHSIRVNSQWKLCFIWKNGEAREVEFCDYHS